MRKETYVLILLLGFMLVTACGEATSPPERRQVMIYAIQTPQRAAITDTIRVSFQYNTSPCDTAVVVESEFSRTEYGWASQVLDHMVSVGSPSLKPIGRHFCTSWSRRTKLLLRCALRNPVKQIACAQWQVRSARSSATAVGVLEAETRKCQTTESAV